MLPFGVTIPATVPQGSEIPEGLMNNPVYIFTSMYITTQYLLLHISAVDRHFQGTTSTYSFKKYTAIYPTTAILTTHTPLKRI
jgi:hypothetical protein